MKIEAVSVSFESAPESSLEETYEGFYQVVQTLEDKPEPSHMWQVVTPTGGFGGQEFVPLMSVIGQLKTWCLRSTRALRGHSLSLPSL